MIFADTDFYQNEYLLGRSEVIPLSEFLFWSRKASERINRNRVEFNPDEIPERLSMCVCEVAEFLYQDSENRKSGKKTSESVGAYSVNYADQKQSDDDVRSAIRNIVIDWLSNTSLHNDFVFRGVR